MRKVVLIFVFIFLGFAIQAQESFLFKGQASSWLHYSAENENSLMWGGRYLPQINFSKAFKNDRQFDFETSANIFGSLIFNKNEETLDFDGQIKPYRAWMRYSDKQFEVRAGLQKINFGSASMFRPLMWFDEVDARDPLKLTDGVWGLLARYYFLNNANVWLWALYGNEQARGWEYAERNMDYPEYGGRLQFPFLKSEMGFSFHHQMIDARTISIVNFPFESVSENKIGYDIKIDWLLGLWFEGVWSKKNADLGFLKNQEMMTVGLDYTFAIGNGLYFITEHFLASNDEKAFQFKQSIHLTATSFSYPIGLFDNISTIFYYDWTNNSAYNFVNWQKQFNKWSLQLMAYWNPEHSVLPSAGDPSRLYGGKGIQVMLIFNH